MITNGVLLILISTGVVSYLGFQNRMLMERLIFSTRHVLAGREYYRLFTSGWLHADWGHLLFNMISFYFFAGTIERVHGLAPMLFIYLSAIAGGGLLSLFIHRHHEYRALGASGGVCGIIFAHIFLFPGGSIIVFPLPIGIPTWLYAILFLVGSYWQMREQRGNIGHDAHLGGAVIGLLVATAMYPHIVRENTLLYGAVLVISLGLFVHLVWNPFHLPGRRAGRRESDEPGHPRYSTAHLQAQREVDRILEKVAQTGLHSLTPEEQKILNREADKLRGREGR